MIPHTTQHTVKYKKSLDANKMVAVVMPVSYGTNKTKGCCEFCLWGKGEINPQCPNKHFKQ